MITIKDFLPFIFLMVIILSVLIQSHKSIEKNNTCPYCKGKSIKNIRTRNTYTRARGIIHQCANNHQWFTEE